MSDVTSSGTAKRRARGGRQGGETAAGWLFVSPAVIILVLFLLVPIIMALWVSVSDWGGRGSPVQPGNAGFVGFSNYGELLGGETLEARQFGQALRNNFYYVLFVVPVQTIVSLLLAILVNNKMLKAKGAFRTAFYFPSVTSSVAITVIFLFLFSATGAVNRFVSALGAEGPNWFMDPRGLIHIFLGNFGVDTAPTALANHGFLGVTWWEWLSGPSVAMSVFMFMAIFTTSGTFMLLFIAALQQISGEVEEAAMVDGTTAWQRMRLVTIPMLRPTIFTVITLGLIGTWQVFDQIYTGSQGQGNTMTPAFLSYQTSFIGQNWGQGAAIAFILFAIIVTMTIIQRIVLREKDTIPKRKRFYKDGVPPVAVAATGGSTGSAGGPTAAVAVAAVGEAATTGDVNSEVKE